MTLTTVPGAIGRPLTVLNTTDSSNNYAMEAVHAGKAGHGAAFFALEQTAGRGQRGKTWQTQPGENIVLSVVLDPSKYAISRPFELNWVFSLAARTLFDQFSFGNTTIKWPNDIYWRDRKAAGILIENVFRGTTWTHAIAGIGMNINQTSFPEALRTPVSLKQVTGKYHDPLELTGIFFALLEQELDTFRQHGALHVLSTYNQQLFSLNQPVRLKQENKVFETTITGVNSAGQLCTRDVVERCFDFGRVEWVW